MTTIPNQVYTIKLSNGDEIVTRITDESAELYTIQRPLTVVPNRDGIQMIFGLFTADGDKPVLLNKTAVCMMAPARQEIGDSYIEAITGIKTVTNKILMG